jgi:polar amino acid transport system permease protein
VQQPSSAPTPLIPSPDGRVVPRRRIIRSEKRGLIIALISTVGVLVLFAVIAISAPGSELVRNAFFSPSHARDALLGTEDLGSVAVAFFTVTVRMFLVAEVLVLVFGLVLAVLRGLPGPAFFPVRAMTIAFIDLFRGTPLLLVIFIVGFGLPGAGLGFLSRLSQFHYGVISLTLVYSAYVAEVYRAGIESVHQSQTAAARSLGLSRWQALRYVVLPQAVRRVIPPLLNDFVGLQKDTALVSVIGLVEVVRTAGSYAAKYFNFTSYVVAAGLFVLLTIPLARFTDHLIARDQRRMRASGGVR